MELNTALYLKALRCDKDAAGEKGNVSNFTIQNTIWKVPVLYNTEANKHKHLQVVVNS